MATLRSCDFINGNMAWRHLLCGALGVYSDEDAEACITAIKEGREPPAPTSTKFHVSLPEMQDHIDSRLAQMYGHASAPGGSAPQQASALKDLGLETKRVDKFGDKSTSPNACAQCGAVGAPTVTFKKCSKCSAVGS